MPSTTPPQSPRALRRGTALALATIAGLAAAPAGSAQAACSYSNAFNGSTFNYTRCEMTDVDQVRDDDASALTPGLPNNGKMYCAPTAALDALTYIANHGHPYVLPGAGNWGPEAGFPPFSQYNKMTGAISSMGALMGTDPFTGTGGAGALNGLKVWLAASGGTFVPLKLTAKPQSPVRLRDMAALAVGGGLVMPVVGWYAWDGSGWWRTGGHVLALTMAKGSGATQTIGLRDPAKTSASDDIYSQSTFTTENYKLTSETAKFGGTQQTMQRVNGLGGNAFLDGYYVILPLLALSGDTGSVIGHKPGQLTPEQGSPESSQVSFTSADGRAIADLAFDPAVTSHPYLTEGSDAVWQLDTLSGASERVATVPGARRIALGGPERTRYVLSDDAIVALDPDGDTRARVMLSTRLADVAYDATRDLVIGISQDGEKLVSFDPALRSQTTHELSNAACPGGSSSLAVDPASGAIWVHCERSPRLVRATLSERGASTETVELLGAHAPTGLTITDDGKLAVTDAGRIDVYDTAGRPVTSPLSGLPAGGPIDVARTFTNTDATQDRDPSQRNG